MSERWVDVSHEALIRGWPRLRGWIEEDRAGLRLHRRLTEAAAEWLKSRDESALYRGARLSQAVEWRDRNNPPLNELERAFLDAGVAIEQHEAHARERRRRRVMVSLSASLLVFVVLAGFATLQWRQAQRQTQVALARQLGAQADLLRDQPEMLFRRLLLASEALKRLHAVRAQSLEVDLALRQALALLPRHIARLGGDWWHREAHFSPDGRHLIVGAFSNRQARVLEIDTGKELARLDEELGLGLTAHFGRESVRFAMAGPCCRKELVGLSAEGKSFVTMNSNGSQDVVQVWEMASGRELLRLEVRGSSAYALSADGRYLAASTYSEGITRVWDVQARHEIPGSAPGIVRTFSQDGTVVTTSRGLWEVTAELKQVFSWGPETFNVVLTGDGGQVAIWIERDGQKQIEVWSRAAKQMTASVLTPGSEGRLHAVTPDGRSVILRTSNRREVQLHDVAARAIVSHAALATVGAVVTPAGQHLIASLHQGESGVDVWALGQEGGDVLVIDHENKVVAIGLTPLGGLTTIAQNSEKLIIRAWDVRARRERPERARQVTGTAAVFAPDGQSFAVMGDGGLEVRRVDDPQPVAKFAYGNPAAVVWSLDGRYLAAQKDQDVRVWNLSSHQSVGQLTLPGRPTALAVARGGASLAAVVSSGKVTRSGEIHSAKLWKVATGEELRSFEPDEGQSIRSDTHCAMSQDAQYVVTQDLTVWEVQTGTSLSKLGLGEVVTDCVMSADGRYLVTSSPQGMVRLWDLESGREAFRIPTKDRPLALDQESRYLATISDRNTVRVWSLWQDDLIEEACQRAPRNLSEKEWREYIGDDAYHKTCPKLP